MKCGSLVKEGHEFEQERKRSKCNQIEIIMHCNVTERHRSQLVRAAWLWCRKSPEGHDFEA